MTANSQQSSTNQRHESNSYSRHLAPSRVDACSAPCLLQHSTSHKWLDPPHGNMWLDPPHGNMWLVPHMEQCTCGWIPHTAHYRLRNLIWDFILRWAVGFLFGISFIRCLLLWDLMIWGSLVSRYADIWESGKLAGALQNHKKAWDGKVHWRRICGRKVVFPFILPDGNRTWVLLSLIYLL